jgi:mannose-6-phosphate isomerase-like protein (cupin superfamily)
MFTHIEEIKSRQLSPGVEEKLLIRPPDTTYNILTFKLLILNPSSEIAVPSDNKEYIYFLLEGRGTVSVLWLKGNWDYPVRSDFAVWIPMLSHRIINSGDNQLRCLVAECMNHSAIDDRDLFVEVVDIRRLSEIALISGKEQMIIDPIKFQNVNSKFNLCACDTIYPGGATDLHVPTGRCEESSYILRGKGEMVIGNRRQKVHAGTVAHAHADTLHRELNTGKDLFEYYIVETHD